MKQVMIVLILITLATSCMAQSKALNLLSSAAIPGLGQIRNGSSYGYGMLATELGIVASLMFLNNEEKLSTAGYKDYAVKYAHVLPGVYPSEYYSHLSRYDSSSFDAGGYNAMIRQEALQHYPDDPTAQQAYIEANSYPDEQAWTWDSLENRREYSQMRIHTKNLRDYSKIATGVLVLNHIVSIIDVLRYPVGQDSRLSFSFDGERRMLNLDYSF